MSQFPHLKHADFNSNHLTELFWGLNRLINWSCSEQSLAQSRCCWSHSYYRHTSANSHPPTHLPTSPSWVICARRKGLEILDQESLSLFPSNRILSLSFLSWTRCSQMDPTWPLLPEYPSLLRLLLTLFSPIPPAHLSSFLLPNSYSSCRMPAKHQLPCEPYQAQPSFGWPPLESFSQAIGVRLLCSINYFSVWRQLSKQF